MLFEPFHTELFLFWGPSVRLGETDLLVQIDTLQLRVGLHLRSQLLSVPSYRVSIPVRHCPVEKLHVHSMLLYYLEESFLLFDSPRRFDAKLSLVLN